MMNNSKRHWKCHLNCNLNVQSCIPKLGRQWKLLVSSSVSMKPFCVLLWNVNAYLKFNPFQKASLRNYIWRQFLSHDLFRSFSFYKVCCFFCQCVTFLENRNYIMGLSRGSESSNSPGHKTVDCCFFVFFFWIVFFFVVFAWQCKIN